MDRELGNPHIFVALWPHFSYNKSMQYRSFLRFFGAPAFTLLAVLSLSGHSAYAQVATSTEQTSAQQLQQSIAPANAAPGTDPTALLSQIENSGNPFAGLTQQQQQQIAQDIQQMLNNYTQQVSNEQIPKFLDVTMQPPYPQPNQQTTITLSDTQSDLSRAKIYWYKDGAIVASGIGATSYSFLAPDAGKTTTITVSLQTVEGYSFSQKINVTPELITLLWQGMTYTHPFYKGKALAAADQNVKIVAMPSFVASGTPIAASNLIYVWKSGETTYLDQSGYGKNSVIVPMAHRLDATTVTVDISNISNTVHAEKTITIMPSDPKIAFYQNDPLLGILYNNALKTLSTSATEAVVHAVPYYFSSVPGAEYAWSLNGIDVNVNQPDITLNGNSGVSKATVSVYSPGQVAQYGSSVLDVNLGQKNSGVSLGG